MSPQYVASTQVPDARSGRQLHETEHTTLMSIGLDFRSSATRKGEERR